MLKELSPAAACGEKRSADAAALHSTGDEAAKAARLEPAESQSLQHSYTEQYKPQQLPVACATSADKGPRSSLEDVHVCLLDALEGAPSPLPPSDVGCARTVMARGPYPQGRMFVYVPAEGTATAAVQSCRIPSALSVRTWRGRLSHFAVYDGHGGSECAHFAAKHLHAAVLAAGLLTQRLPEAQRPGAVRSSVCACVGGQGRGGEGVQGQGGLCHVCLCRAPSAHRYPR